MESPLKDISIFEDGFGSPPSLHLLRISFASPSFYTHSRLSFFLFSFCYKSISSIALTVIWLCVNRFIFYPSYNLCFVTQNLTKYCPNKWQATYDLFLILQFVGCALKTESVLKLWHIVSRHSLAVSPIRRHLLFSN